MTPDDSPTVGRTLARLLRRGAVFMHVEKADEGERVCLTFRSGHKTVNVNRLAPHGAFLLGPDARLAIEILTALVQLDKGTE